MTGKLEGISGLNEPTTSAQCDLGKGGIGRDEDPLKAVVFAEPDG